MEGIRLRRSSPSPVREGHPIVVKLDHAVVPVRLGPMATQRILLVDDDPGFLEIMTHVLSAHGRVLVTAADGEEALAEARAKTPDLIILDINMPGMDGFTLIQHLRSEAAFALVPVIFLTALDDPGSRVRGFHLGADDYLAKDILLEELTARVARALRRRAQTARIGRSTTNLLMSAACLLDETGRGPSMEGQ